MHEERKRCNVITLGLSYIRRGDNKLGLSIILQPIVDNHQTNVIGTHHSSTTNRILAEITEDWMSLCSNFQFRRDKTIGSYAKGRQLFLKEKGTQLPILSSV